MQRITAARAAARFPEIVLVEKQIEEGDLVLWSAVIWSDDASGSEVTPISFRKDFFSATRLEQEDVAKAYRSQLSLRGQRIVGTAMHLMAELIDLVSRRRQGL